MAVQRIHQNCKNGCFLYGDYFDTVLVIFCSYCYDGNTSEKVEKIAIGEKDYHKCSLYVIVCIATAYQ